MELDDLKVAWTELDRRIASVEEVVRADYRTRRLGSIRRVLRGLGAGQAVQILAGIVMIANVAPYWIFHRSVPPLLLAGLALHIYGIAIVCASVVQLLVIARIYYTAPVLLFQKRMAELRRLRILSALVAGLPWFVLWVPVLVIAAERLAGVDLYARMPLWILANVTFGAVALAASVWMARRVADRPDRPRCIQRLIDGLAGRSLQRVARELKEIDAFGSPS